MQQNRHASRAAFTKLELAVVLVMVLVGLGVFVTYVGRTREASNQQTCVHNLRRIGEGTLSFHADKKFLPPARIAPNYATWAVLIAGRVQQDTGLEHWDTAKRFADQPEQARVAVVSPYFCPGRPRSAWQSSAGAGPDQDPAQGTLGDYACASGDGDPLRPWTGPTANGAMIVGEVLEERDGLILRWSGRNTLASLVRGQSYTLLIGEKHVPLRALGEPNNGDASLFNGALPASSARVGGPAYGLAPLADAPFNTNFGGPHDRVCQFLHADGSVRAYGVSISEEVLGQLIRRD